MSLAFTGPCARLIDTDLPRIGYSIGVGEDELHAFLDVETNGGGFDKQGRVKILFEPHLFYKHLGPGVKRDKAVQAGLAYPKWRKGYPADSYPRLLMAIDIDETAALKSCSWGIGQVLGENYVAAGYESVQQMVRLFVAGGEAEQLSGSVRFIKANHLDDELRTHNWAAFARGYNGPGYKENAYDTKLTNAFARWSKIRDTLWSPEQKVKDAIPVTTSLKIALDKSPDDRIALQPAVGKPALTSASEVKIVVVPTARPQVPVIPIAEPAPPRFVGWREGLRRVFGG